MAGSITRALNWDNVYEQQFIAVTPQGDEVILYQTNHENTTSESNSMIQLSSRTGFDNISCSSYSITKHGIIGVGSQHGSISIFDINSPTLPTLHLRPKQSRLCNSISFNNSNNIVVGYEKGKNDNALQIWDIEEYSSNTLNNIHGISNDKRPVSSYISNESVLSAIYYTNSSSNILCGTNKYLREIDTRIEQPVFQLSTKCTMGIIIDPFQSHFFQSYSDDGSLSIWDRRKLGSNQKQKSSSSNSSSTVESPVLHFSKLLNDSSLNKNINPCVRYSTTRRGEFSAIFNGDLIRRWHTGVVPASKSNLTSTSSSTANSKSADSSILQSLNQQSSQLYKPNEESLFVSMVLDNKTDYEKVVSFDYSPDILSLTSNNFVCMRQSGTVFRMPVVESIEAMDFNPRNEFTIVGPEGLMTNFLSTDDSNQDDILQKTRKTDTQTKFGNLSLDDRYRENSSNNDDENLDPATSTIEDGSMIENNRINNHRLSYDDGYNYPLNAYVDSNAIYKNDICVIIRKRVSMGYGIDPDKNIEILEELDPNDNQQALRHAWKWLSLAKKSLEKGTMISEGIDLGYQGVQGIWNGVDALNNQSRVISKSDKINEAWFTQAVKSIISRKGKKFIGINIPEDSEKKSQRKLCLIVSGWYLTESEFEEKLQLLISMGFISKAAGWAVFHGNVNKAIEILSNSKREKLRLMATAVAGYLAYKNSHVNSPWKDQCRKMASELDDPYLRAIFAFIADDDWWDVLDEHSLPLRERIGVAIRNLSDKDLTVYLNRIADTVVQKGELEGLILTGITPKGIDLLQSCVDRTSDVQTAALVSTFACPRYFVDDRIKHWIDCYRSMMNSWSMFSYRAKFDVNRTKLSKTFDGHISIKATPKQVYLQCIRCNKNISKPKNIALNNNSISSSSNSNYPNSSTSVSNYNTVNNQVLLKQFSKTNNKKNELLNSCPHCGAPLPRCSICLMSLGSEIETDTASSPIISSSYINNNKENINKEINNNNNLNSSSIIKKIDKNFKNWFSFCLSCNHCYHALHAEEWFSTHYVCPVPDCECQCNSK
ncbi:hypothetical protein KGF54_003705 [Candida jiufengensis]|uniref:uncharacterized protein n=1 Tax=Candida jiufengensis TaxID=497108 RepID=UPI0022259B4E|nr:uncharacterized protein KGF54_003705 [Candida jiufengensis]KAI5952838.1 hypothetical protein KGF54_003705 [Candida jiufengensis]